MFGDLISTFKWYTYNDFYIVNRLKIFNHCGLFHRFAIIFYMENVVQHFLLYYFNVNWFLLNIEILVIPWFFLLHVLSYQFLDYCLF